MAIHNIVDRQALEFQLRMQYLTPFVIQHYDYDFEDLLIDDEANDVFTATNSYENRDEVIPFHFKSPEKIDKQEMTNILRFYAYAGMSATRRVHFKRYMDVNAAVLKTLRNENHIH